jgi:hypothetical protein
MKSFPFEERPCRVLVTGARSPAAPDLVRFLTARGHVVTVADSICFPAARACRGARAFLRHPPPRQQFARFASWIQRRTAEFDWTWPCCEEVFWLAQAHGPPLFAPPWEVLQRVHAKNRLCELVDGLVDGFGVPPCTPLSEAVPAGGAVPAGFVAKPVYGRFGHRTIVGSRQLPHILDAREWILQPRIRGRERCLHAIAHAGQLQACVVYGDPARTGPEPCYRFVRETAPELEAFASVFCAAHRWTGQLGLDIITDESGGHWVVDANPRLTSGMHLLQRPAAATVSLPWISRWRSPAPEPHDHNGLSAPGDRGPAWLAPFTMLEIIVRFGLPVERAATADMQWP